MRTARKARRQLKLRVRFGWQTRLIAGYFRKWNAMSCRCRKHGRGCSPKVVASMCHCGGGDSGYHPAVRARIDGKRAVRRWRDEYDGE